MTDWQMLTQVELPLAMTVIIAGLRVATVIAIGTATIAAAIGAGGLGVYIFRGLRGGGSNNTLVLAGATMASGALHPVTKAALHHAPCPVLVARRGIR